jgi:hypothetical protein
MLYDLLSGKAKIAVNVVFTVTAATIFYFYCLDQGPMYWVAGWIADSRGYYSVTLAFLLCLVPFLGPLWTLIFLLDRHTSLFKDPRKL